MALMAIDHARAFVAREHPFEYWGEPLPSYETALPFVTRLLTHFCAPGFFLLMGAGMALLAAARRREGWSEGRIALYFVKRGALLFVVEQFLENPAWVIGSLGGRVEAPMSALTPVGNGPILALGVLFALGAAMIVWSATTRWPASLILGASAAAILATQVLTPPISDAEFPFSGWLRLLLIPGHTGALYVLYPIVPWLGVAGFGIAFGQKLAAGGREWLDGTRSLQIGLGALALFAAVRLAGGFGNLHTPVPPGWIGFLNVTKYPPSIGFIALTLGVDLLVLALFSANRARLAERSGPLLTFGRTALFFYIVHLYVYALIGYAFPHGAPVAMVYPMWLLGLAILYPLCRRYERFKSSTPPDSLWRFF